MELSLPLWCLTVHAFLCKQTFGLTFNIAFDFIGLVAADVVAVGVVMGAVEMGVGMVVVVVMVVGVVMVVVVVVAMVERKTSLTNLVPV